MAESIDEGKRLARRRRMREQREEMERVSDLMFLGFEVASVYLILSIQKERKKAIKAAMRRMREAKRSKRQPGKVRHTLSQANTHVHSNITACYTVCFNAAGSRRERDAAGRRRRRQVAGAHHDDGREDVLDHRPAQRRERRARQTADDGRCLQEEQRVSSVSTASALTSRRSRLTGAVSMQTCEDVYEVRE